MAPILFTIGPYNAYAFGIFLAIAFLFSTFVVWKYAKSDLKEEEYVNAYFYFSIVAIIVARLFYIIKNFDQFGLIVLKYFVVRDTPGLSLYAGFIGGFFFLWWYAREKKLVFNRLLDIFSIALSVSLFFTKIGEQLGGAGFGKETNSFMGIKIVGFTGRYHPVELYEALLFLLLSYFLIWFYKIQNRKKWNEGITFLIFATTGSLMNFLVEFFKVNNVYLYGFTVKQIISLFIFILFLILVILKIKRTNTKI